MWLISMIEEVNRAMKDDEDSPCAEYELLVLDSKYWKLSVTQPSHIPQHPIRTILLVPHRITAILLLPSSHIIIRVAPSVIILVVLLVIRLTIFLVGYPFSFSPTRDGTTSSRCGGVERRCSERLEGWGSESTSTGGERGRFALFPVVGRHSAEHDERDVEVGWGYRENGARTRS